MRRSIPQILGLLIIHFLRKFYLSWPTILSADDRMTFTCETTSTIQYILANVLNTFLDPAQISMLQGRLPVDEYGLKVSDQVRKFVHEFNDQP